MKHLKSILVTLLLFIILCLLQLFRVWIERENDPNQLIKSWADQEKYAQINTYFTNQAQVTEESIKILQAQLDERYKDSKAINADKEEKLWIDAYSTTCEKYVSYKQTVLNTTVIGVGGDFFLFHPLPLVCGTYLPTTEANTDFVLFDEDSAWKLFGSLDVVGMEVEIEKKTYYVTGVIKKEKNIVSKASGRLEPTIYLPYSALNKSELTIQCYEVCVPNPVNQYGFRMVEEVFGIFQKNKEIVSYSNRFQTLELLKEMPNYLYRSMKTDPIAYPYWENEMRVIQDILTLVIVIQSIVVISFLGVVIGYVRKILKLNKVCGYTSHVIIE